MNVSGPVSPNHLSFLHLLYVRLEEPVLSGQVVEGPRSLIRNVCAQLVYGKCISIHSELLLDSLLSFNLDILDELINEVLTYEPLVNGIKKKQSCPICFSLTGRNKQAKRSKLCNKNTKTL